MIDPKSIEQVISESAAQRAISRNLRNSLGPKMTRSTTGQFGGQGKGLTTESFKNLKSLQQREGQQLSRQAAEKLKADLLKQRALKTSQSGAITLGSKVGTATGIGATMTAAAVAAAMIDRGMKKTFGSGLLPNAREGARRPIKSARSGVKFIAENL